jgi:uracil-DNA glycosylase
MTTKKQNYLQTMGVEVWKMKSPNGSKSKDCADCACAQSVASSDWDALQQKALNCTLCDLSKTRNHVVFGVGNREADIMLIGEAPGANEDLQGEPFVGRGGMLLNEMLRAMGLERAKVYIANILKCRPPGNRDPLPHEVELCTSYLQQQIALIKPKVLIAVGRIAAQFLLNTDESMGKLRGKSYNYGERQTPLFVIYHPAYLLRSPREKSKAYVDLLRIQKFLAQQ